MTISVSMEWNLRQVMADRGMFKTSDLMPLLAERGIGLSREQVYRLVTGTPQRISLDVLAGLCDALGCGVSDLMTPMATRAKAARTGTDDLPAGPGIGDLRPIRAIVRRPDAQ